MPYAVISPVGVSLFQRAYGPEGYQAEIQRLRREGSSARSSVWDEVRRNLGAHLAQSDEAGRVEESCAETKSLLTLVRSRGEAWPASLYLLPTETAESQVCAQVLQGHFKKRHGLDSVVRNIQGMDYADPVRFQQVGIRSFLSWLSSLIRDCQERGLEPVLNATPGFKAETSLALLLAQLLGASVFYIHERMADRVIFLPSLPLTVTPEYWRKWGDLVLAVGSLADDEGRGMDGRRFQALAGHRYDFPEAEILFDDYDGGKTLSALGQILFEVYKAPAAGLASAGNISPNEKILWPADEHHWPRGFASALGQIARVEFVRHIRPTRFTAAGSSGVSRAFDAAEPGVVICRHFGGEYAAEARVETTAQNREEWEVARQRIQSVLIAYGDLPSEEGAALVVGVLEAYQSVEGVIKQNVALQAEIDRLRSEMGEMESRCKKRLADQKSHYRKQIRELEQKLHEAQTQATSPPSQDR